MAVAWDVSYESTNMKGRVMKAVRFHKTGGPEVLVYEDVPDPTPRDGEVLIKVEAAGLNFSDVMRRRGDDYPEPSPTPFIHAFNLAHPFGGLALSVRCAIIQDTQTSDTGSVSTGFHKEW